MVSILLFRFMGFALSFTGKSPHNLKSYIQSNEGSNNYTIAFIKSLRKRLLEFKIQSY